MLAGILLPTFHKQCTSWCVCCRIARLNVSLIFQTNVTIKTTLFELSRSKKVRKGLSQNPIAFWGGRDWILSANTTFALVFAHWAATEVLEDAVTTRPEMHRLDVERREM